MKGLKTMLLPELLPLPPHQAAGHLLDIQQQQQQDLSRHPRAVQLGSQQPLLPIQVPSSISFSNKHPSSSSKHPYKVYNSNLLQPQLQPDLLHQELQTSHLLLLLQQASNLPSKPTNMCQCRGSRQPQPNPFKTQSQMRSLQGHPLSRTPQMCQQ